MDFGSFSSSSASSGKHIAFRQSPVKRKTGRKKFRVTRHPVYHGVRERNCGKWVCEVREPHKKSRIWLGTYATPEMAARAHDVAALALRGKYARLNFPDSTWALPAASSAQPEDIRCAAAKAAEMYRPHSSSARTMPAAEMGVGEVGLSSTTVVAFVDEEALFNMPGLLIEMAAGLLVTPPGMQRSFDWDAEWVAEELTLWPHD